MTVTGSISITNLAERHLRLVGVAFLVHAFEGISITNLAERHLRPGNWDLTIPVGSGYINHESSRKAFETTCRRLCNPFNTLPISITNLAERHLRHRRLVHPCSQSTIRISITNLAERHLRLATTSDRHKFVWPHINHESSRKAFETWSETRSS